MHTIKFFVQMQDELNAELEELEQEDLDEQMINIGAPSHELPSVPDTELPERGKYLMACISMNTML